MYKLSKTHVLVDSLSKLSYITEPTSVFDQTTNASLFYAKLEWLKDVKEFLRTRLEGTLSVQYKQRWSRK